MSTSASVLKYWAYIGGIQVPINYAQITNVQGDMTSGIMQGPFSPFLAHLPRSTKLTLFEYDSAVDDEPILAFDGTITQITESISENGVALNIGFKSDGHIWQLRTRRMSQIETKFSCALSKEIGVNTAGGASISKNAIGPNGITDWMNDIFRASGNDAAKAAMVFLTSMFRPPEKKADPKSGYYYVDGNTQKVMRRQEGKGQNDEEMAGDYCDLVKNDAWFPFVTRYYQDYKVPYKAAYVPQKNSAYFAAQYMEMLLQGKLNSAGFGEVDYWTLACSAAAYLDCEIVSVPDASYNNHHLVEFIAKPISPLGALPLCNIVYPNQIHQYTHTKNFFKEPSRVTAIGKSTPWIQNDGMSIFSTYTCGPTIKDGTLASFKIPDETTFSEGFSEYEKEYGIYPKSLSDLHLDIILRVVRENKKEDLAKVSSVMNNEFVKHYFGSKEFSVSVTPNNRYVIGMTIAVLRHDLHHTLAYLFGTTKRWDASGQASLELHCAYSRQYDFTIDENIREFVDGFEEKENRDLYARHIGMNSSAIVTAGVNTIDAVKEAYKSWNTTYDKNVEVMKGANPGKYRRNHCTYSQYCQFLDNTTNEESGFDIFELTMPKVMPPQIVWNLDTSDVGANMESAKYHYYDPFTEEAIEATAYDPDYTELGEPGPIIPSTYISGIVNCHLRYLSEVGHTVEY